MRRSGVKASAWVRIFATALAWLVCTTAAHAQTTTTPPADDRVVFVNRIIFVGNEHLSSDELRGRMRTKEPSFFSIWNKPKFDRGVIERDAAQLQAYYHAIGYPDATVKVEKVEYLENLRFADITLRVVEGEPIRVGTVAFAGHLILKQEDLREGLLLKPEAPYNAALLRTDVFHLRNKYYDLGYLGVLIADSTRITGRKVDIVFTIDPGEALNVGNITIEGNKLVRRRVIEAEIEVKTGDVCRFEKVVKTQRNLFETGLFNVVDVLPENIDPVKKTVDIRIRVRERKESWIETGFGVGNVLGSRIFAEWGTRNLLGYGRTLRFKVQYAFDIFEGDEVDFDKLQFVNNYYRYDAIYQQRRVFGLKLGAGVNAFIEDDETVPDLDVYTRGTTFGVSHQFGRPRPDFGYDNEFTVSFSIENITRNQLGLPEEKSRSNILGTSLSRDTRDFILNPKRGEYRLLTASVAGGILGGQNDFYTITGNEQMYHPRGLTVLAWRARVGFGDSYGRSATVPVEERFYLGGGNSVRGYAEASLGPRTGVGVDSAVDGGQFMMLANVEFRYPLPYFGKWNFSGTFFFDGGNVWAEVSDVSATDFRLTSSVSETTVNDFRYGIGLGIRYNTPIGPIRLDYGYPLKPDRFDPELDNEHGTFYLSLGQIF